MLLQGLKTSNPKENKKNSQGQSQKRKSKCKTKKGSDLSLDEQITCFAEIIVNQVLKDLNFYENK
jgi:ribosomal protein S25